MSLDKNLHLRRRKDGVEVITLEADSPKGYARSYRVNQWTTVRYVKSGRKGYIKDDDLEADFVVIGSCNPDERWSRNARAMFPSGTINAESAAAMEDLRERDIAKRRKHILKTTFGDLKGEISANSQTQLDQAIHMILAGV